MNRDIVNILREWDFDPDNNVRFFTASDGRELMQIRLPLGIEQYELDGRPDGHRPFEQDSYLNIYLGKLKQAQDNRQIFTIGIKDFNLLHNEALLFYYRYVILFQTEDYYRTVRDTEHNIKICDLIDQYCSEKAKEQILQYLPYILRVYAISQAMLALQGMETDQARDYLETTISKIKSLPIIETSIFDLEKERSLKQLREVLEQVKSRHPNEREILEEELLHAVESENYEMAAQLRDRLQNLDDNE